MQTLLFVVLSIVAVAVLCHSVLNVYWIKDMEREIDQVRRDCYHETMILEEADRGQANALHLLGEKVKELVLKTTQEDSNQNQKLAHLLERERPCV